MPIRNPTFAEASDQQGIPRYWQLRSFVRTRRFAGFGPAPERGVEAFERWTAFVTSLERTERAFFDARPEGIEDFAEGFGTETFAWRFADTRNERARFVGAGAETFAHGFRNDGFRLRWADVDAQSAQFTNMPIERFEVGFKNDNFAWSMSQATTVAARFTGLAAETFEASWPLVAGGW